MIILILFTSSSLQAFIWDSSRLEYEAAQDCDLVTIGDIFGRSGYGIGLKLNSLWTEKFTRDILEFHESKKQLHIICKIFPPNHYNKFNILL